MNDRPTRRRMLHAILAGATAGTAVSFGAPLRAQAWPTRPVKLLVGFSAGGGADAIARTIAQRLGDALGQSVVVENRPGATSTIAAEVLAKSPPDGYALMLADSSLLIASRAMAKVNFDVLTSFAPIGSVAIAPLAIAVAANSPLRSLEDMATAAKRQDPKLIYATSGIGTVHHLAMESLLAQAKLEMTHLPYRGAAQILPDLIGGQVPIGVVSAGAAVGPVEAGKIRVLGLTTPAKLASAPWRPVADWLPGFDAAPRLFLIAPAGTPDAILARLDEENRRAIADPAVAQTLQKQGAVPTPSSRAELATLLPAEVERWDALIRRGNISIK
ncbi:MAG: Bug family tripartite tricarboxylate transporter substrate binding protein [Lautropia sp.]